MSEAAPFFSDLAEGPEGGHAVWLMTADGVRIRLGLWPEGSKGLVLLFPGRTEYIEKYGRTAAALARRGYGCAAVDWRGQGLSDRANAEPLMGHVDSFSEYQTDVAAVLAHFGDTPPRFLLSHSMGGTIALRALVDGMLVDAAVFSAPMWRIRFAPGLAPVARALTGAARMTGTGQRFAPGAGLESYMKSPAFENNMLTRDWQTFAWMRSQLAAHPELALAGPSLQWLGAALAECRALEGLPSPAVPAYCALGAQERIVTPAAITERMARWPGGTLDLVAGAEHEVMMEVEAVREAFYDATAALFDAHR